MTKTLLSLSILFTLALFTIGCSSEDKLADGVAVGDAAIAQGKEQLANVPESERGTAEAALGQAQAMQQRNNDPARVRAMQEMQKQRGN